MVEGKVWRPEGWKVPSSLFIEKENYRDKQQSEAILTTYRYGYEKGADAILKAIFGEEYSGFAIEELRKQFKRN